jgi:hypothetical protein
MKRILKSAVGAIDPIDPSRIGGCGRFGEPPLPTKPGLHFLKISQAAPVPPQRTRRVRYPLLSTIGS